MGIHVHMPSVEEMLKATTLDTQEVTRIKRDALRQMDTEVRRSQLVKPDALSDKFVGWRFKQDWEAQDLPLGVVAGTDYDYFDAALRDVIWHFRQFGFPGSVDPDRPGYRAHGGLTTGGAYNSLFEVWQNGKKIETYTGLRGPWVDFGPTADYALFLEKSTTTTTNNLGAPYLYGVGVLHAIAARLAVKYAKEMRIFAHTQQPRGGSTSAVTRKYRKVPITMFPVIRIMHRHYKGGKHRG